MQCSDGSLYCGVSPDVEARIAKHNAGKGAKFIQEKIYADGSPMAGRFRMEEER